MSEGQISDVQPDRRDPTLSHVRVGSRRVADVPTAQAPALGVRAGEPWTPALADACVHAMETRRAYKRACAMLGRGDVSAAHLRDSLVAAGFSPEVASGTVDRLKASRLVDDHATAERGAEALLARRPQAVGALRARLEREGLDPDAIEQAIARVAGDDATTAREAAAAIAERLEPGLSDAVRWRRMLAGLGRRGFGEEESLDAARAVLGEPPGGDAEPDCPPTTEE